MGLEKRRCVLISTLGYDNAHSRWIICRQVKLFRLFEKWIFGYFRMGQCHVFLRDEIVDRD